MSDWISVDEAGRAAANLIMDLRVKIKQMPDLDKEMLDQLLFDLELDVHRSLDKSND